MTRSKPDQPTSRDDMHDPEHDDVTTNHVNAVTRVLQDMRDSLECHHNLLRCASVAIYSPYHFHRLFVEVTSTTPARFLTALRMQAAKAQLADTDKSVATVCWDVGYESVGTFTSQFTRLAGLSPSNFRKLVDRAAGQTIGDALAEDTHRRGTAASIELSSISSSQVAIVGLFSSDIPQETPVSYATLRGQCRGLVDRESLCDTNQLFAVAYPADTSLVTVALGQTTNVLVGRRNLLPDAATSARDRPCRDSAIRVLMRPPLTIHPPIVSCAAAMQMTAQGRG